MSDPLLNLMRHNEELLERLSRKQREIDDLRGQNRELRQAIAELVKPDAVKPALVVTIPPQ